MNKEQLKVPKLRFKEFTGEWEEKKLKNACFINPKSDKLPDDFIYVDLESVDNGILKSQKLINIGGAPSRAQRLLEVEDILYQTVRPYQKNNLYFNINSSFRFVASTGYAQLRAYESSKFLYHYLHNQRFVDSVIERCTGTSYPAINSSDLSEMFLSFPSLPEQQKIADFLSKVDEKIEKLTKKKELLEQYKKGVMQKIFSQEIRFKDGNGNDFPEWEEKELGELCNITTGKLDANAMVQNGEYRFYTCAKEFYFIDNYAFDTEALLISGNGANVGYIHYYKGKFNAYQRTYVLDGFNENMVYIKYFLDKNLKTRILSEKKEGNTPYIVLSTLSEMKIVLPSLPEQQKIADFLSVLDKKIDIASQELAGVQEFKKGLLQQMFV